MPFCSYFDRLCQKLLDGVPFFGSQVRRSLVPAVQHERRLNDGEKIPPDRRSGDCLYTNELVIKVIYVATAKLARGRVIDKNWEAN
tara:strand:+ start:3354 stop:3611 length:258 start_codon:yes stop_codon:yes gene_type:complete